jgi:hypothetical protein
MARISSYNPDTTVEGGDKLIGTSSDGTTKSYTLDSIGKYYIDNNVISVAGQQNFRFVDSVNDIGNGTFFIDGLNANGKAFTLLTSLSVSKYNTKGVLITNFLQKVFDKKFRLSSVEDPDSFADIEVSEIQNHPTQAGFYRVVLGDISGQGFVNKGETYSVQSIANTDAFFIYSQEVNSTVWQINHMLDKNPSVTIVNSSDVQVVAEVEYVDANNLTIRFANSTSGKAYLN